MKTCLLVVCLVATAVSSAFAETYRAPVSKPRDKPRKAPLLTPRDVDGVIPRGVRGGNFIQMFNPKAPAKYGTSQEAVVFDPVQTNVNPRHDDSNKWKGIKFFTFRF
jgi:hypothetical protein